MPHKIILTGYPLTKMRQQGRLVYFDMLEKGNPNVPKGLPTTKEIRYTCLLTERIWNRLAIDNMEDIRNYRFAIQGEPTFSLPIELTGVIGVVISKLEVVGKKETQPTPIIDEENTKLSLDQIIVPEGYLKKVPNQYKLQEIIDYVKGTGMLDKPIIIEKESNLLLNGYKRYYVAKLMGIRDVPVKYADGNIA